MYNPFAIPQPHADIVLHTVIENAGAETTRLSFTLCNNGDTPLLAGDFTLCFSVVRDLVAESFEGASLLCKQGSFHEIAPPADMRIDAGDSWAFSAQNSKLPLQHISDAPQGVYIKHRPPPPAYTDVVSTVAVFADKDENIFDQDTVPQTHPNRDSLPIVPMPHHCVRYDDAACTLVQGFVFKTVDNPIAKQAVSGAKQLSKCLFASFDMLAETPQGSPVYFEDNGDLGDEAYTLSLKTDRIVLSAHTANGYFYGLVSLIQLVHANTETNTMDIVDAPRFAYRGQHLDVVRQFYTVDEIKQLLDVMALHKLNTFHWHLTDDEAWRLEIRSMPELTEKLAYRGEGQCVPPAFGSNYRPYGGYYSRDDVKDIVAYAAARYIAVIPEIDMPGHCFGLLRLLLALNEAADTTQYTSVQSYSRNTLNPALPATYDFIDKVIAEVADMFPDKRIHIGADERPPGAWRQSPACKALMKAEGLADFDALQTYFVKRVQQLIRKHGKTMGAWEEASEDGDIDTDCYIVSWRGIVAGLNAAHKGHAVVMSPAQYLYWDMAQSAHPFDPGLSWAGYVRLSDTYHYDPLQMDDAHAMDGKKLGEVSAEDLNRIIGVQGCIWSENIHDKHRLYFMAMPRLSAMAEVAWCTPQNKHYDGFLYTLHRHFLPLLHKAGIAHRPLDYIQQCLHYKRTNNI